MAQNKKKAQSIYRMCDVLIIGAGSAGLRAAGKYLQKLIMGTNILGYTQKIL